MNNITELKENQVFVFGSSLNGHHVGGAARQAKDQFGAIEGQSYGLQGQSFAIPTLDRKMNQLPLQAIEQYLQDLTDFAKENQDKEFLLTPIGTGIAGFSIGEIKSILPELPDNVKLIGNW